jgi:membrane protein DedA with SNARE-associated domain
MLEELLKAIPVLFSSMLKFVLGPIGGFAAGLNPITTILSTVLGSMASVFAFTFFGEWLKTRVLSRIGGKKKKFTVNSRKFVTIWRKYGMVGVATLMPILLTPIGGTILAVGFGAPRSKIIFYMFISASAWAIIFTFAIYEFGKAVLPDFVKP